MLPGADFSAIWGSVGATRARGPLARGVTVSCCNLGQFWCNFGCFLVQFFLADGVCSEIRSRRLLGNFWCSSGVFLAQLECSFWHSPRVFTCLRWTIRGRSFAAGHLRLRETFSSLL